MTDDLARHTTSLSKARTKKLREIAQAEGCDLTAVANKAVDECYKAHRLRVKASRPRCGTLEKPVVGFADRTDDGGLLIQLRFSVDGAEWLRKDLADLRELGFDVSDEADAVTEILKLGSIRTASPAKARREASELTPEPEDGSQLVN